MQSLISVSAILGFIIYLIVAIEYSLILRKSGVIFLPAFLFSALWSLASWLFDTPAALFTLDLVYVLAWSSCLLLIFNQRQQLGRFSLRWGLVWSIPALALAGVV